VKAPPAAGSPWLLDLRNKVRARLRAQGATQAGLAWHLGITEKHVSQLLTGQVTGSPEMLDRIAAAAGLRIAIVDAEAPAPVLPRRRPGSGRRGVPREAGKFAGTREGRVTR
jgi:transcriptional regulator with XRE-family HTH domain